MEKHSYYRTWEWLGHRGHGSGCGLTAFSSHSLYTSHGHYKPGGRGQSWPRGPSLILKQQGMGLWARSPGADWAWPDFSVGSTPQGAWLSLAGQAPAVSILPWDIGSAVLFWDLYPTERHSSQLPLGDVWVIICCPRREIFMGIHINLLSLLYWELEKRTRI